MLGLHFCARAFSSCGTRGPLFIAACGPHYRGLSLRSTGSRRAGSVVVTHGPSCSAACGILPDQGSNPCPLHWQADSQPLRHQGSLIDFFNYCFFLVLWSLYFYLTFYSTWNLFWYKEWCVGIQIFFFQLASGCHKPIYFIPTDLECYLDLIPGSHLGLAST